MRGYFVAGTDTGVGKTEVARALCTLMRGVHPFKPVETGCPPDAPEDALALMQAARYGGALDDVCFYRFRMPAAPVVAAEAEGRAIDPELIVRRIKAADHVLVEAAGGLLVPITRDFTNLDLAERLGLPVVLVGRAGLGTQNHCALSAWALRQRGLRIAGIVLNRVAPEDDPSVATNPQWVAHLTGARVVGPTAFVRDAADRLTQVAQIVAALR